MKSFVVSTFVIVSLFVYGCEDSLSKNMPGTERNAVPLKKQITQVVRKKNVKAMRIKAVKNSESNGQGFNQRPLDLTVPLKIKAATNKISYAMSSSRKQFLPDLFNAQKDNEKSSVQLVGKLIKRGDEGMGKDKSADGAGIDFKLTH